MHTQAGGLHRFNSGKVLLPSMTNASTSSAPICSSCCMVSNEISLNSTAMPMNVSRRILAMFCSWDRPGEKHPGIIKHSLLLLTLGVSPFLHLSYSDEKIYSSRQTPVYIVFRVHPTQACNYNYALKTLLIMHIPVLYQPKNWINIYNSNIITVTVTDVLNI